MAEAATPYPLWRSRRRRSPLRGRSGKLRLRQLLAAMILAGVAVAALLSLRDGEGDPRQALADARGALADGNYTRARDQALVAVKAEPRSPAAQWVLARAYLELGDGSAADAVLTRAQLAGVAPERIRPYRAGARLLQGDSDAALGLPAATGAATDDAIYGDRVRARALAETGDPGAAQQLLARLDDPAAATDLGRIRFGEGDIGGAAEVVARALAADPRNPATLTLQGEVIRSRYGLLAALPWFEAALKRDAAYPPALIEYAATLTEAGRSGDALAAARRAVAARPNMPQARFVMAVIAARAGDVELAHSMLQHTGGVLGDVPAVLLLGGALDHVQGHDELAAAQWRGLLDSQPDNWMVRRLLAAALLQSSDPQGALDTVAPIARRRDADSYALEIAARAAWLAGNRPAWAALHDRAMADARGPATVIASGVSVSALSLAAANAPGDPSRALALIRGLVTAGDISGATERAGALASALPGTPAAHVVLGDVMAAAGRYADAAAAYARAANLLFDEATMLKLVDALGRRGRSGDAAQALALYAAQNPQSATALRIAGHWQVEAGEHDGAIVTLQRARALSGNRDAAVLADLARAYAGTGSGAAARRFGRAAYALAPMSVDVVAAYAAALDAVGDAEGARQLRTKARQLVASSG